MYSVGEWLHDATIKLQNKCISSARLDSLILLEHATNLDKSYLLAHPEQILKKEIYKNLDQGVERRLKYEPIAYIVGYKEFYGYKFRVNRHVLIPRPESESFISLLVNLKPSKNECLIDVGTGSGALAITAAKHFTGLQVIASDSSKQALEVARQNSQNLIANIKFIHANLLDFGLLQPANYIFANLPYVPKKYDVLPDIFYEPLRAIFTNKQGLELIAKIIPQASNKLKPGGYLFIESLQNQQNEIQKMCRKQGLKLVSFEGLVQFFRKEL